MEFLVVGFDPTQGSSHIFEVKQPGMSMDHGLAGYWAIGSGAPMALASLTG